MMEQMGQMGGGANFGDDMEGELEGDELAEEGEAKEAAGSKEANVGYSGQSASGHSTDSSSRRLSKEFQLEEEKTMHIAFCIVKNLVQLSEPPDLSAMRLLQFAACRHHPLQVAT